MRPRYRNAAAHANGIGAVGYAGGNGNGVSARSIANGRCKGNAAFDETARLAIMRM